MSFFSSLFRKTKSDDQLPALSTPRENAGGKRGGNKKALASFEVKAIIPGTMHVRGDIESSEGGVIDGYVTGNITIKSSEAALLIRPTARVCGDVKVANLHIGGEVLGDVEAEYVRLYPGCVLQGRVRARRMVVDDGAYFTNDSIGVAPKGEAESNVALIDRSRRVLEANPDRKSSPNVGDGTRR